MSDGISDTGKFPKNYFDSFCAQSGATFHFGKPEVDQHRSKDMSDGISDSGKFPNNYFESFQAYSEATFDYSATEPSQKMSDYLA